MPSTTAIATNLPPRPPPSSIAEPVRGSPVLSPRIADPRQQRSGSVLPSSPPQRPSTPPQQAADEKTENGSKNPEPVDKETFDQILDLDDDNFAWEMARAYIEQAETTFEEMEAAIADRDCKKLSELGHFLKGSSATLGVTGVRDSCQLIQEYGKMRANKAEIDVALSKIAAAVKEARKEHKEGEAWLRKWYLGAKAKGRITEEDEDD